jgi:hypothetical protein
MTRDVSIRHIEEVDISRIAIRQAFRQIWRNVERAVAVRDHATQQHCVIRLFS